MVQIKSNNGVTDDVNGRGSDNEVGKGDVIVEDRLPDSAPTTRAEERPRRGAIFIKGIKIYDFIIF